MKPAFYELPSYKKKQSTLTKRHWKGGAYSHLRKRVKRSCVRKGCGKTFFVTPSDPKKYCSQSCAAIVNNLRRSQGPPVFKSRLATLYQNGLSANEIAGKLGTSSNKVTYWLRKFQIPKRSLSEAIYLKYNPNGDPFKIKKNLTAEETKLLGFGLGLYWGEGSKKSTYGVRLANTDPRLINKFLEFLIKICQINTQKLRFWVQVFDDTDPERALKFWCRKLNVKPEQFYKTIVTPSRGKGTYKEKCKFGVLTVSFGNTKLRKRLLSMLEQTQVLPVKLR